MEVSGILRGARFVRDVEGTRMEYRGWWFAPFRHLFTAPPKRSVREPKKTRWAHDLDVRGLPATVNAPTKSEARAVLKKLTGLRRLPLGTRLRAVGAVQAAND